MTDSQSGGNDGVRVALVTGAARGQGLAIVKRLRADGVRVVAGDVLADELRSAVSTLDDDGVVPVELASTASPGTGRRC